MRAIETIAGIVRLKSSYGSEYKHLIKLGLPVMVTQLGIVVVSFADTIMVAHCGTRELGAVAFVNAIFMVATVMQLGFAAGLTPLVGALFGRKDTQGVGMMMRAGVISNLVVSLCFTIILGGVYFFVDRMGQDADLLPLIRPYYLIVLATLIPMALFNALQQTSNGCTDTATPMWIILGCNLLNIFGNWLLIGGEMGFPRMGLLGAGLSTLIARVVSALVITGIYIFSSKRRVYLAGFGRGEAGKIRTDCRKVWITSYPVMIQSGIECFLWSFGGVVSGWFGTIQLASYQVVNTIAQLGFMIYMGFGVATSIRVANLWGVTDYRGAKRIATAGLHLILCLAVISSLCFYLFFDPLLRFFTPDVALEAAALPLLMPLILYQFGDAVQLTYANALRGTSVVKPLLWASVISYILVGIPLMLMLAVKYDLGNVGVYYSFIVALLCAALILWLSFRQVIRAGIAENEPVRKEDK